MKAFLPICHLKNVYFYMYLCARDSCYFQNQSKNHCNASYQVETCRGWLILIIIVRQLHLLHCSFEIWLHIVEIMCFFICLLDIFMYEYLITLLMFLYCWACCGHMINI